jgi:hypothetical protein
MNAKRSRRKVITFGITPRKSGERYPSGGRKRHEVAMDREDARKTALEARQRVFGLSEADALQPAANAVYGRLWLTGALSRAQHEALTRYVEVKHRYQRAIDAPLEAREPPPDAWDRGGGDYVDWVARAREEYDAMQGALTEVCVSFRSPEPKAALEVIVNKDVDMPELYGGLRQAANALARFWGMEKIF